MGDSAKYLYYARFGGAPPDRSFFYPKLIAATALSTGSLMTLLVAQTALGVLTALLVFLVLKHEFRARTWIATLAALLLALDPAQLFYERMVLAESAGGLCLIVCLASALRYIGTTNPLWLVAQALCGILAVSFRLSLLPVVLGLAPLPPLIVWLAERRQIRIGARRFLLHLVVAVTATGASHEAYRLWYGHAARAEAGYVANSGFFRLTLVAPLVKAEHFAGTGVSADLLAEVQLPLQNPRLREAQLWWHEGLVAVLKRHAGKRANEVAGQVASAAVCNDPIGYLRLARLTMSDYFNSAEASGRMLDDLGHRPAAEREIAAWRQQFGYDFEGVADKKTPIYEYFGASGPWLTFCLFSLGPLSLLMLATNWNNVRGPALLVSLSSWGLTAGHALFSAIICFRYLHPFPILMSVVLGALLERVMPSPKL